jgi:hypothetical protein
LKLEHDRHRTAAFRLRNEVLAEGKNEISTSIDLCVFGTG